MKKLILPLIVVAASGGYVWSQHGLATADAGLDAQADAPEAPQQVALPEAAAEPVAPSLILPAAPAAVPATVPATEAVPTTMAEARPTTTVAAPKPHIVRPPEPQMVGYVDATPKYQAPEPVAPAKAQLVASSGIHFADGAFTGAVKDAYYGPLQVKAVIKSGKLAKVQVLQYPNDRRTSRYINSQALPMLQSEAISAQSSDVDFITGATLTSRAFARSLADALSQAVS